MKRQITVEIPDEEQCEECDFEHYDGDNVWCTLFHESLSRFDSCCDECMKIRKDSTLNATKPEGEL